MDEEQTDEQSTKKWQKTKYALGGAGLLTAVPIAVPFVWAGYVFKETSKLLFKTTKTAFQHPWITAGLLAGGITYNNYAGTINDALSELTTDTYQTYTEQRLESVTQENEVLKQQNKALEHYARSSPENPVTPLEDKINKELFVGLGIGAGGALLGVGGYAYLRRPRKKIRVVKN